MKNTFCTCPWYKGAHTLHLHARTHRWHTSACGKRSKLTLGNWRTCVVVCKSSYVRWETFHRLSIIPHCSNQIGCFNLISGLQLILPRLHPDSMVSLSVVYGSLLSSYSRCLHKAVSKRQNLTYWAGARKDNGANEKEAEFQNKVYELVNYYFVGSSWNLLLRISVVFLLIFAWLWCSVCNH